MSRRPPIPPLILTLFPYTPLFRSIPLSLLHKIRKSAHLLSPVSPSRLTEELLKIINSGHTYDIVKLALDTDLYMYLQPGATALMYEDSSFEKKYLDHLKDLDNLQLVDPNCRMGQNKTTYTQELKQICLIIGME